MLNFLKNSFFPSLILLTIFAGLLFSLKHKVHILDKELRSIKSQIIAEKENIHILNAEYTYLTSPKRIKQLVENNLNMQILASNQVLNSIELAEMLKKYENEIVKQQATGETATDLGASRD